MQLGVIEQGIRWLDDGIIAKFTIIIVNMWIGIPYTMLMCTGILMNIPEDLYESAKIDGASLFIFCPLYFLKLCTYPASAALSINTCSFLFLLSL